VEDEVSPLFSEAVYKQYMVPKLLRIFTVHEYHVHVLLLQYLPLFVHLVEKEDLELEILPQVIKYTPQVIKYTPQVIKYTPQVIKYTPQVIKYTPQVIKSC